MEARAPTTTHVEFLPARNLEADPDAHDLGIPTTVKEATTAPADPNKGPQPEMILCGDFGCPDGYILSALQINLCLCRKIHIYTTI